MTRIATSLVALIALCLSVASVTASDDRYGYKIVSTESDFESVLFELKNAIVDRGLVVDYEGKLNDMLERTSEAASSVTEGGQKSPYSSALFLQFCSAKLTHEVISANPRNISICPYVVFIYEAHSKPGVINVGYRKPIGDRSKVSRKALAKVEALLEGVIADAVK